MSTATEQHEAQPIALRSNREQWITAAKIAAAFVVGFILAGVVGPIVLAIVVGLLTGHT